MCWKLIEKINRATCDRRFTLFNSPFKELLSQNPHHDCSKRGGGIKGRLNNVKKKQTTWSGRAPCIFLTESLSLLSSTRQPALQMSFNKLTPDLTPGSPIVLLLVGVEHQDYCHVKYCRCTLKWKLFSFARIDQFRVATAIKRLATHFTSGQTGALSVSFLFVPQESHGQAGLTRINTKVGKIHIKHVKWGKYIWYFDRNTIEKFWKIQIDRGESCHRHHTFAPTFHPLHAPALCPPPGFTFSFQLESQYKIQNTKYKIQNTKYKIQNTKYKTQNTKYKCSRSAHHQALNFLFNWKSPKNLLFTLHCTEMA